MGKKKAAPKNSFYFYMQHYMRTHRGIQWADVSTAASPSWKTMDKAAREPYEQMAKEDKIRMKSMPPEDRPQRPQRQYDILTAQGVPYSVVERERNEKLAKEESAKLRIRQLIENEFDLDTIKEQPFYFICAVHFCCTSDQPPVFIPAELAVSSFSFESGLTRKFHTFVNPGALPLGYAFEARDHSEKTHRLPVPPNALGESRLYKIRSDIVQFITPKNGFNQSAATEKELVVFSTEGNIPMIESILEQCFDEDSNIRINVFPLEELFFALKQKACAVADKQTDVRHIAISNLLLEQDPFQHMDGLGCKFHDDEDVSQHCALSRVVRWCYAFGNHLCGDMGIAAQPGVHLPHKADVRPVPPPRRRYPNQSAAGPGAASGSTRAAQSTAFVASMAPSEPKRSSRASNSVKYEVSDSDSDNEAGTWTTASRRGQSTTTATGATSTFASTARTVNTDETYFDEEPSSYRRGAGRGRPNVDEFPPLGGRRR